MTETQHQDAQDASPHNLRALVDRLGPALVLYARQLCDCPEDIVQDALMKLAKQTPWPDNPPAWLYRVVRNGAISANRSRQRRRRHEQTVAQMRQSWFVSDNGTAHDAALATDALAAMPADQREVVVARLWGQLTYQQIADLTGSSVSAVHRRYHHAIEHLRERLGES